MSLGPELLLRRGFTVQQMPPDFLEDVAQLEHGHIAAHAVAVVGNGSQFGKLRRAHLRRKMVQLRDVVPRRKIGIAPKSQDKNASGRLDPVKTRGIALEIPWRALDIELGVFAGPGMIKRRMISDEIKKQRDSPRMQLQANLIKRIPVPDARIRGVLRDGIG